MRLAIRIGVAAVAMLLAPIVQAGETPPTQAKRNFQIAAQPLSRALLEFSQQADLIVTAPAELVGDKQACVARDCKLPLRRRVRSRSTERAASRVSGLRAL
jgi:hypothetical protein